MKTPKRLAQGGYIENPGNVPLVTENASEGLYEAHMRKIEFRGYDLEMKRWYYGYYVRREESSAYPMSQDPIGDAIKHELTQVKHYIIWDEHMDWGLATIWKKASVDARSIGQWTGKISNNGEKVYEGDIVRHYFRGENGSHESVSVVGDRDSEFIDSGYLFEYGEFGDDYVEVLGNAYEQQ